MGVTCLPPQCASGSLWDCISDAPVVEYMVEVTKAAVIYPAFSKELVRFLSRNGPFFTKPFSIWISISHASSLSVTMKFAVYMVFLLTTCFMCFYFYFFLFCVHGCTF